MGDGGAFEYFIYKCCGAVEAILKINSVANEPARFYELAVSKNGREPSCRCGSGDIHSLQDQEVRLEDNDNVYTLCFKVSERRFDILRPPSIRHHDLDLKICGGGIDFVPLPCGLNIARVMNDPNLLRAGHDFPRNLKLLCR